MVTQGGRKVEENSEIIRLRFKDPNDLDDFYQFIFQVGSVENQRFGPAGGYTAYIQKSMLPEVQEHFGDKFEVVVD